MNRERNTSNSPTIVQMTGNYQPPRYKMSLPIHFRKPSTISYNDPISENPCASYHLIFMITGNPGLISYYSMFLSTLHKLLIDKNQDSDVFQIYGQSLAGFELNDRPHPVTCMPYSLEDQIEILLQDLNDRNIPSGPRKGQQYDSIILIGHSVGAYIIMEMLNRLRKSASPLKVKAGILLFPTITHLAKSPSGVKFSGSFKIPGFTRGLSIVGKALLWPIPRPMLKWMVGLVLGMPDDSAETTTRFLKSSMGIWQALWVVLPS
jgi:pimeloyl-ACP methyl ester carboxylesterase